VNDTLTMVTCALLVVAGALSLIGLLATAANFSILFEQRRRQALGIPGHVSFVPGIGPLFLTIGWALAHKIVPSALGFVVLAVWLLDPLVWMLIAVAVDWIRRKPGDKP
jgi:hypothetical protein